MCTYTSLTVVKIQIKRNKEVRGEKKPVVGTDASREGSECMVIGEFKGVQLSCLSFAFIPCMDKNPFRVLARGPTYRRGRRRRISI